MTKFFNKLLLSLLLILTMNIAGAQNLVPVSVQEFLDEYAFTQTLKSPSSVPTRFVPPRMIDGQEMVEAFIGIRDEGVIPILQGAGVTVSSVFDGFVTALIPLEALSSTAKLPGVTDIEVSKKVEMCTDTTLNVTNAIDVINGEMNELPHNYDGTGVIIGIIDSGYDYQHRAFMRSDNPSITRISRVYSTQLTTGHQARYNKNIRLPGSVFMGNQIYSLTKDNTGTHGTHTASIAAGTHVNGYGGMAPGAEIVLCSAVDMSNNLSLVEIANCIRYIDAYADSVAKPCVMSLSISTPDGSHDGKDYLTKVIKQIMGPGRIFVIAAGNNANKSFYAHKLASQSSPINLLFNSYTKSADSTYYYQGYVADIWMRDARSNFYYKVHVLDKTTNKIAWESDQLSSSKTLTPADLGGYYDIDSTVSSNGYVKVNLKTSSDGSKYGMDIALVNLVSTSYETVSGVKKSRYGLGLTIYPRKTTPCEVDAWACVTKTGYGTTKGAITTTDGSVVSRFYSGGSDSCSIGAYAVGDSIISAGAFIGRNSYFSLSRNSIVTDKSLTEGDIYASSSYQIAGCGPTGVALPTICAPGVNVVAAGSRYSYFSIYHPNTVMKTEDGCVWGVMSGTSMAAPTVAGIIALWMQAKPDLSVAEAKEIIAQSAIRDNFTTGDKSVNFGPNGKIDALAGMKLVLERIGFIPGDVDADGKVGIDDITALIDYLLNSQGTVIDERAADFNNDESITIADLTALIDFLLT